MNFALRGLGSDEETFEVNRFGSSGDFIYVRGDLSHTLELPAGFQFFVKAQGQAANEPLINSEQFSGGGLGTVRGLLESEVLGDNGLLGTVELRTPSIGDLLGKAVDDWRFYLFSDGGFLANDTPLIEAPYQYNLLSTGAGTRIKLGRPHQRGRSMSAFAHRRFARVPRPTRHLHPESDPGASV